MTIQHSRALIIGGVTASGKSELAIQFAQTVAGVIVNADSAQLYRDLPILTARPDAADCSRVPHELYGILDATQVTSVALWIDLVRQCIGGIRERSGIPVIVGGTGLYLSALLNGLAPVPEIDRDIRERVRNMDPGEVDALLAEQDLAAHQRLGAGDRQRRSRALEVVLATGRSLAAWQRDQHVALEPDGIAMALLPPRQAVRENARQRMWRMIELGVVEEVVRLRDRIGDPLAHPIGRTLGTLELLQYADGQLSLEEAVDRIVIRVGQYVKRQETWFRRQWPEEQIIRDFGSSRAAIDSLRARWMNARC